MLEIKSIVVTCVLAVATPQGQICVKPDGSVEIPPTVTIDAASRAFWETLGKQYPYLKDLKAE